MIDWRRVENELSRLAADAQPAHLLSVSLALPRAPALALQGSWSYWERPDQGLRLIGLGKAFYVQSAGEGRFAALAAARRGLVTGWRYLGVTPRAFLGFAFAPHGGEPLPNAALWAPELLVTAQGRNTMLTLSCAAAEAATALARWRTLWREATTPVRALCGESRRAAWSAPGFTAMPSSLSDQAFLARGRAALAAIGAGRVDKLVLTRTAVVRTPAACTPDALLAALAVQHPACAVFSIGGADFAFIGASPETLLALDDETLSVDALAGTAWGNLTLQGEKNRREHEFVVRAIIAALEDCCKDIVCPALPEVMQLEGLAHLRRRIIARPRPETGLFDLIARLHPTPAVGGFPTQTALDWLDRLHEERGAWYTGAFGWLDAGGNADLAVCLRCGLIEEQRVTLYAGAGFVAGSDPEQEFAETEAKFAAMRAALDTCRQGRAVA